MLPSAASHCRASCVSGGQAGELAHHQVHHVFAIALGADALQVPEPAPGPGAEDEQLLLGQGGQELDREERIAAGLVVNQVRQGGSRLSGGMERVRNETPDIRARQRRQHDLAHPPARPPDLLQAARQRMGRAHLVVPEGAQQQQRSHVRLDRQITEQVQGRRVQPLQIVQEQRQRMLRPGEHAEQAAEHQLETALCVLRRQLRHGGLRADQ